MKMGKQTNFLLSCSALGNLQAKQKCEQNFNAFSFINLVDKVDNHQQWLNR